MKEIAGDKLRGHLETLILATLEQGEAHGLEILRRLELRGCGLLRLKEGSLYPALYRMESAGDIRAVWEKDQHGRRGARRRIYRLTPQGGRRLKQGRGEWRTFVETLGAILDATKMAAT
jgi:DNA-binding PadR family transcriptional regulator